MLKVSDDLVMDKDWHRQYRDSHRTEANMKVTDHRYIKNEHPEGPFIIKYNTCIIPA